jgi:hypothetical protein
MMVAQKTYVCQKPCRAIAVFKEGRRRVTSSIPIAAGLRVKMVDPTHKLLAIVQPVGDPETELRISWRTFSNKWADES